MLLRAKIRKTELPERPNNFVFFHPIAVNIAAPAEALPVEGRPVVEPVHRVFESRMLALERFGEFRAGHGIFRR